MKIRTGIGLVFLFALCLSIPAAADDGMGPMIGMADPSAVWAEEMGYEYQIRTNEDGSQYGVIILPDGSEVDAWQLYREAHPPEDEPMIGMPDPSVSSPSSIVCIDEPLIGMPNPSAVWAEEMGYEYEIRTNEDGSQYGVCILPDGSEVDAWQLYREAHPPEGIEIRSPAEIAAASFGHEGLSLQSDGMNQFRTGNNQRSRLNLFLGPDQDGELVQGQSRIMQQLSVHSRLVQ
ncbi:MAG TPA: DUF333 domain-containing protein [Methanoregulaceae archaeon]|nr:DUF333 domain-containing protein [Methanoregulaceae archaeon]MDD5048825.1 DUF333 domain-containing protein [Methanoregulaceae archaeon]MDD5685875.1 DUF333 domain-containing protein [Methanoregulaceae archaeon]HQC12865.1 DUF333 domain-containing protein [Methanoregulaceae archaeon]HRX33506.1 DUF333 domain-containing protein [Methanoregulaceae archaeon]